MSAIFVGSQWGEPLLLGSYVVIHPLQFFSEVDVMRQASWTVRSSKVFTTHLAPAAVMNVSLVLSVVHFFSGDVLFKSYKQMELEYIMVWQSRNYF